MRGDFDGNGYQYIDFGSGSDWRERHAGWERLYSEECILALHKQQNKASEDLLKAAKAMLAYFTSGNHVPVSRAVISADCAEVTALRAAVAALEHKT